MGVYIQNNKFPDVLISMDDAIDAFCNCKNLDENEFEENLKKLRIFDAWIIDHSKWKTIEESFASDELTNTSYECCSCGFAITTDTENFLEEFSYCPECGARMDLEDCDVDIIEVGKIYDCVDGKMWREKQESDQP